MRTYDVVIAGSGIAGGFLARQLNRTFPDLSILVLEAAEAMRDRKVGESTVEVAASYMIRRLNLGTYLYQHQLPKNGLRFFFDAPDKDLPLTRMSEIGSDHMPFHPSFQLERAALERDLVTMNRAAGVEVELGAKIVDLVIDGASRHRVRYEKGGETHEIACRWLCDASGRRQLVHRKLGNAVHKETRLNTGAAWARYSNVAGLDAIDDRDWRARVRHTSRHLSTNHMMYDGYWIWFIPLAGDVMSVVAVFDKDRIGAGPRQREELEAFLRSHRSSRELMDGAVFEDFQAYAHLPYYSDVYFSTDRWAVTGEAGAFTDPFYSPGSDFIATANEFITAMIGSELAGDAEAFRHKVDAYNAYYRFKYESTIRLYIKMYPVFGSYELFRWKYLLDFNSYYNLILWPYLADRLTDVQWIRNELSLTDSVLRAISTLADHFAALADHLRPSGEYFAHNEGRWANGLNGVSQFETRLGPVLDESFRKRELDKAYASVFSALLERRAREPDLSRRARVLGELDLPRVLVFKELSERGLSRFFDRIAAKMTRELQGEFPEARIERVVLRPASGGASPLEVVGMSADDPARARVEQRAQALWDAPGDSLVHIEL